MAHDTDITVLLDRSGSMASILDDTIGGFNSFLKDQQSQEGSAKMTLVQFDNDYDEVYTGVDIKEVEALTPKTFVPRGSTALLDSMARTITATGVRLGSIPADDRPQNVVFVIITDGAENCSKEVTRDKVFEMVKHQTEKYNWTFLYLGANQDAISVGTGLGIGASNSLSYSANSAGVRNSYSAASVAVDHIRTGAKFRGFTSDQRDDSLKS